MAVVSDRWSVVQSLSRYARDGDTKSPYTVRPVFRLSLSSVSPVLRSVVRIQYADSDSVELTAPNWGAFTAGRVIAYIGVGQMIVPKKAIVTEISQVGLVQNASPGYCSEVSPSQLRGFMNGTMTVIVTMGNVIGVGVSIPYVQELRPIGWIVSTAYRDARACF